MRLGRGNRSTWESTEPAPGPISIIKLHSTGCLQVLVFSWETFQQATQGKTTPHKDHTSIPQAQGSHKEVVTIRRHARWQFRVWGPRQQSSVLLQFISLCKKWRHHTTWRAYIHVSRDKASRLKWQMRCGAKVGGISGICLAFKVTFHLFLYSEL